MIRQFYPESYGELYRYLSRDSARSYFIRLGLLRPETFAGIYGVCGKQGLRGLLCLRKSGTLQLYAEDCEAAQALGTLLDELPWQLLVAPGSVMGALRSHRTMAGIETKAFLACCEHFLPLPENTAVEPLKLTDLEEVNALYDRTFDQHMSLRQMEEKLRDRRGRGVLIKKEGRIAAVAQSEFEEHHSALIVGVATDPAYRRRGLARMAVQSLCATLAGEGKTLWLQYDNPQAGSLYEELGFKVEELIVHCRRR